MARNPRPTNLSLLAGDRRAAGRQSIDLPLAIPVSPPWLTDEAKLEWDEITPVLARMRVLTEADQIAVAMLSDYLARWKAMGEQLKKIGYIYPIKDREGKVVAMKRTPQVSIHLEYGLIVQKLLSQFGLTPSARASLSSVGKTETQNIIFSRTMFAQQED